MLMTETMHPDAEIHNPRRAAFSGTSYLQHSFEKFKQELLARGIYYPDEWGGTVIAHYGLVVRLRSAESADLAEDFDRLVAVRPSDDFDLCGRSVWAAD